MKRNFRLFTIREGGRVKKKPDHYSRESFILVWVERSIRFGIMEQRVVVVRMAQKCGLVNWQLLEISQHVRPQVQDVNEDIIVSIVTTMLVPEAQAVHKLVHDNVPLK